MKILVIGSKGFIGSHCVDYFSQGHEVWGCDVVLDYNTPNYISIDAVDSDFLGLFEQRQYDVCINCSGAANVPFSLEKPFNDFKLNTLNVFKLLEAIRKHAPHCKFITMSSAAVYGNPESLPIRESQQIMPVSPYGYHKVMAEMICEEYSKYWNIQTCCLRIFSAYGPRLKKQIFWDLYHKIIRDDQPCLWGTGHESRDFIYISDIIRIIDLAIQHSSFNGEVVNVANGKQIEIQEVAETVRKLIGTDKTISFNQASRKGDPINWEADISIIRQWGYEPSVELEDGVRSYIEWVRKFA
ncbi:MAG: NAD-dependent epimerase/dehydratase family protein [Bacteroidaceae bacterium]|nr:NAD-dependent epimerase/dehydratase family protein [Bacteroidaceae bacterium]